MRTGVSIYSFNKLTSTGKMTVQDCVKAAKNMGFDGVEFTDIPGDNKVELAKELKALCAAEGIAVVNYTIGADLLNGYAGGKPEDEIARVKKQVDIAEILGAPGMRHDATWGLSKPNRKWRGFDCVTPQLAEGIREITEYAASKGIRTMIENHGLFAQDSDRVEKLVNTVAHENFGVLCDIGNFLCADENPTFAVGRVAPYTFHAHAKDFHIKSGDGVNPGRGFFGSRAGNYLRGAIIGHGEVPVLQCLRILKANGYDGFVSIEFEGMEDALTGIEVGLANLKKIIAML